MHDYAIFGHDRASIGRWLGMAAIVLSGVFSFAIAQFKEITGWGFIEVSIATGALYVLLHWVFNKYAWKIPFFKIPDLNGHWSVNGKTLDEDGNAKHVWDGEVGIEQTWKQISIHLKTKSSQSQSYTATLLKKDGPIGGWLLTYSYNNEPEVEESHELNPHKGYCEVDINTDLKKAKAAYFNHRGRRTFGTINWIRE
jgi:hypothetical protein